LWNVGEAYRIQGWDAAGAGPYAVVTHFHAWALLHLLLITWVITAMALAIFGGGLIVGAPNGQRARGVRAVVATAAGLGLGTAALLVAPVAWTVTTTYWVGTPFDRLTAHPWGTAGVSAGLSLAASGSCFLAMRASSRAKLPTP
jgi:hypothetical protein